MTDDFERDLVKRLREIERRLSLVERRIDQATKAYSQARHQMRRIWLRPPMWTFEQYAPRPVVIPPSYLPITRPSALPRIAIITPSYNYCRYLRYTIESVLSQNYPNLYYHIQDAASTDGTVELLATFGDRISWSSHADTGQAQAINKGFDQIDCQIMAYLNSDDLLLPGTLAHVADIFQSRSDVDVVYGHRIFIDQDGLEVGRAVLPQHNAKAFLWADYIPQETMFWRRRVWDTIGPFDEDFAYALDWEFALRAQAAGFKFQRLPRFLACFRVHDEQKTAARYDIGRLEMQALRKRYLGYEPSQTQIVRAILPYLARQFAFHWMYRCKILRY
jgi:glycosyltransferase involved in cell wall biosynthesis